MTCVCCDQGHKDVVARDGARWCRQCHRTGFKIEVYWGQFGTIDEGSMYDPRYHEVKRKPTAREMNRIEKWLGKELEAMGLLKIGPLE